MCVCVCVCVCVCEREREKERELLSVIIIYYVVHCVFSSSSSTMLCALCFPRRPQLCYTLYVVLRHDASAGGRHGGADECIG